MRAVPGVWVAGSAWRLRGAGAQAASGAHGSRLRRRPAASGRGSLQHPGMRRGQQSSGWHRRLTRGTRCSMQAAVLVLLRAWAGSHLLDAFPVIPVFHGVYASDLPRDSW